MEKNPILYFTQLCATGKLSIADCSPFWEAIVFVVLLVIAIVILTAVRRRSRSQSGKA